MSFSFSSLWAMLWALLHVTDRERDRDRPRTSRDTVSLFLLAYGCTPFRFSYIHIASSPGR